MAGYKKMLVLLDLSEDSEQVVAAGSRHRGALECGHGAAARGRVRAGRAHGRVADADRADRGRADLARARERLRELIARSIRCPSATARVEAGNTKAEILRVAEEERPI